MPKQLKDFQSALIISTAGDGTLSVTIHQANGHYFSPIGQQILQKACEDLLVNLAYNQEPANNS